MTGNTEHNERRRAAADRALQQDADSDWNQPLDTHQITEASRVVK